MSIPVSQKKRGRPATGQDPTITVRLPREMIDRLSEYAIRHGMTRSEAIKAFIEIGLGSVDALGKP